MKTSLKTILLTSAFAIAGSAAGYAQDAAAPAAAAPPAAPTPPTLAPAMGGLAANASPMSFDLSGTPVIGDLLGKTYVTGVVSGFAQFEDHAVPGDHKSIGDLSNGQVFVQKVNGMFQYFVQVGAYSLPYLGAAYAKAGPNTSATFGPFAQGFVKLAPLDNFSIQAGKLQTLIGDEYTFTFENMNIQRGLLWGQEPAVSDGVQINYTMGPVALSASVNDGAYSGRWSWISASAIWTIDPSNTLALVGGGNLSKDYKLNQAQTPLFVNNEQIYNIIYTYSHGPLTISPYFQYTHIPALAKTPLALGGPTTAGSTYGGALLAKYAVNSNFSVAARVEYENSSGSKLTGPNILGPGVGTNGFSLTLTPTYQYNIFFLRAEGSYVHASAPAFGPTFGSKDQFRFAAETGIVF